MEWKPVLRVGVPAGLLLAGLVIGAVTTLFAKSDEPGKPVAAPLQMITETVEKTYTSTAPAPPPVTITQGPPPPAAQFSDGLYLVGTDITPGEYKSDGPGAGGGGHCYWARLRDSTGSDIIANNLTEGPTRVTAVAGEYLEVSGCQFVTA